MKNEVSLTVYKLNLKYIFANYLKRSLWKKEWVLYQDDTVTVTCNLYSIETRVDKLYLYVSAKTKHASSADIVSIPLSIDHRNIEVIESGIYGSVLRTIRYCELDEIKRTEKYARADELDDRLEEDYEDEAEAILDDEGVTNGDIRDAFIRQYKSDKETGVYKAKVLSDLEYTLFSSSYLTFALWVGSDTLYQRYKGYIERACNKTIDDEEFIEKYEELIGAYEVAEMV